MQTRRDKQRDASMDEFVAKPIRVAELHEKPGQIEAR